MWAVWGVRGWVLWTALLALAFSFPLVWAVLGSMGVGRLDSVGVGCFGFVEVACFGFGVPWVWAVWDSVGVGLFEVPLV